MVVGGKVKNIILTGGSKGLGRMICRRLLGEKYNVIVLSRTKPEWGDAIWYRCDLEDKYYLEYALRQILDQFDDIYGIINNAGVQGMIGNSWDIPLSEYKRCMEVNLFSPIYIMNKIIPHMIDGGKIINISGGGATSSRPMFSPYTTSKTALVRYSENLAEELKDKNIQVNCVAPGIMYTNMTEEILALGADKVGTKEYRDACVVKNSYGDFNYVTNLISFLLSQESNYITGKLISAKWDDWKLFDEKMMTKDIFTLRRKTE